MWDLPGLETGPVFTALVGGFFVTEPPGMEFWHLRFGGSPVAQMVKNPLAMQET